MSLYEQIYKQLNQPVLKTMDDVQVEHLVFHNAPLIKTVETSLRCESIGLAFAAGYRSALQCLLPFLDHNRWAAMCVTEAEGNHPRHIKTSMSKDGVLNGAKSFVTLADREPLLVVIAKVGETKTQPILKAACVDSFDQGVSIERMPPLPMAPEISHGRIQFEGVMAHPLEGDGYSDYSKRFRTIEDAYVLTAFVSVVMSLAYRYQMPVSVVERAIVLLNSLMAMRYELKTDHPLMQMHLAGLFEAFKVLCEEFEQSMNCLPPLLASNWWRDKKLFGVASKARQARNARAQEAFVSGRVSPQG